MAFRMTEQAYLVLLALADGPRHGYGVVQAVTALSDGRVRLGAGTLYGVLDRLVEAGYATTAARRPPPTRGSWPPWPPAPGAPSPPDRPSAARDAPAARWP
jgi:hypothetical protein